MSNWKKIIFDGATTENAHLDQISTISETPSKAQGDLETTTLFAKTEDGGANGDIDKIVVQVGGEFKHVAQNLINASESDLIPGTAITSTGGNWNGDGTRTFSLNLSTINGSGLSNASDKLVVKGYANNNIDIASNGIKISSSIVDTDGGLSFSGSKIVVNLDTTKLEFNSVTGAIDRKSGTPGFENLTAFDNGNISAFTYDGSSITDIVIDTTTLDGNAEKGIRNDGGTIFLATASALDTGDTIKWDGTAFELKDALITETAGGAVTIGSGAQTASVAGNFVTEKSVDFQGGSKKITIADTLIILNADSSDANNFGFQAEFSNGNFPQWQYQNDNGTGKDRWGYSIGTTDGAGNSFVGYQRLVTDSNPVASAVESQTGKILRKGNMTVDADGGVWMYTANS
jgi:hypothetical protein